MPRPWKDELGNIIGTDVFDYVSGTIGLTGASARIAVFGGDVFISGTVRTPSGTLGTGGGGAGETAASYLVLATTSSLSNERVLTVSGTSGLRLVDSGPGAAASLAIDNNTVATVSGTTFSGATIHSSGLSGSLTRLSDGSSYLVAGSNVTISSQSNGQIIISSTGGSTAQTLLDLDFTGLSSETITADTSRSWGNVTWQIDGNSWANQSLVVDSNGVTATNTAASKVMIIHALFSDLGLFSSDNFRLWLYATESASVAAGVNSDVPTIDLGARQWDGSSYSTPIITAKLNGYGASGGVSVQGFDGYTDNTAATNAAWASQNVIVIERRGGTYRASFGAYASGFPSYSQLRTFIERPLSISGQNTTGAGWLESQARFYIDMRNNNSTPHNLTLKRLLVQKLP